MKAKKSFGQHFLKEESIAERIANSFQDMTDYKHILEVGPGKGMLTKYLLALPDHDLKVVEADEDMVAYLETHYSDLENKIIFEDFLKVDLATVFDGQEFGLIGNFPYNISSQILIKALDNKEYVTEIVGMFQKEVAQRIAAEPGNKQYGILSVYMQAFYDIKYLFSVKPGSFNPPPKVNSGVIALKRKKDYLSLGCEERLFRTLIKASFGQRRKMLRNTMKPFLPKDVIENDVFFEKRPEQLSIQDFIFLTNLVAQHRSS